MKASNPETNEMVSSTVETPHLKEMYRIYALFRNIKISTQICTG